MLKKHISYCSAIIAAALMTGTLSLMPDTDSLILSAADTNVLETATDKVQENSTEISETDEEKNKTDDFVPEEFPKTTEGFVTRMYKIVLKRNPDQSGLKNWTEKLNKQQAQASDIITGFFLSDEYKSRQTKTSTGEQVTECYNAMLGRNPDSKGFEYWKKCLDSGMSIKAVCAGFAGSSEFKNLCESYGISAGSIKVTNERDKNFERTNFVYRLYDNCLGRKPDTNGLESWCKQLESGMTGAKILEGFVFSQEYKGKETSNEEFVTMLYKTMLGRNPDSQGFNTWKTKLDCQNSRKYVINGFLFSNEFKAQCARAGITVGQKLFDIGEPGTLRYIVNTEKQIPHDTYPLYNIKADNKNEGKPYQAATYRLSEDDKRIIDKFAKEHFTDDMTNYDKLLYTWDWIHMNVKYAKYDKDPEKNLYSKIAGDSFVKACFEKKLGQCLQYNGALAELMVYMGYDVYMLELWLKDDNTGQHFRAEVIFDGVPYSIEVGNYGSNPRWKWFLEKNNVLFNGL